MAGRDIRRLVAAASLQSSPEKMLVARRLLSGMAAVGDAEVVMINDYEGFGRYSVQELGDLLPVRLVQAEKEPSNGASTTDWAVRLQDAGARLIIAVGGDGTQRNVAQAGLHIPILPVAGGTNNVACWNGDQTAAGYAAALYVARQDDPLEVGLQAKLIHVQPENGHEDLALIDAALVRQTYTGALAVWHAEDVSRLLLTVADPARPGLSNLGGFLHPLAPCDEAAVHIRLASPPLPRSRPIRAVLAPGLIASFFVESFYAGPLDESVRWSSPFGGTIALDGERTVVLRPDELVTLSVRRDGPFILDPQKILSRAPH